MRAEPDPADLFPDVAAQGSLAIALRAAASRLGLVLDVVEDDGNRIGRATVPTTPMGREPLRVQGWTFERRWSISGDGRGGGTTSRWLLSGKTDDIESVAVAAHGWQNGLSLAEIEASTPFVELTGQLEVPDDSPAHAIASNWSYLRREAETSGWPEHRALVEAAYARPELRALFAFTSHWSLRLRTGPPEDRGTDLVCLEASRGGPFTVLAKWGGQVIGRTATADEAVSLAVDRVDSRAPGSGEATG
jgi:hypothetical protein